MIPVALLALGAMNGCKTKPSKTVHIENIERVFMHERGNYTFLIRADDDSLKPVTVELRRWDERFITDVPDGMPAWATYQLNGQNTDRVCPYDTEPCNLIIHLHNTKQLYTAGWDHGKFGSGTMNVIE